LKFSSASDEAKDLQKVESFETNLKDKQSSLKLELDKNIKPVKAQSLSDPDSSVISSTENRIVDSKKNGDESRPGSHLWNKWQQPEFILLLFLQMDEELSRLNTATHSQ